MPYISTEALVGAGLIVLLAFGYQYTTAPGSTASSKKAKKKAKRKSGKAGGPVEASSVTASEVDSDVPAVAKKSKKGSKATPTPAASSTSAPLEQVQSQPPPADDGAASQPSKPKTLAEKLVPKPRKTKVDE